jgi:hypothetical protein
MLGIVFPSYPPARGTIAATVMPACELNAQACSDLKQFVQLPVDTEGDSGAERGAALPGRSGHGVHPARSHISVADTYDGAGGRPTGGSNVIGY